MCCCCFKAMYDAVFGVDRESEKNERKSLLQKEPPFSSNVIATLASYVESPNLKHKTQSIQKQKQKVLSCLKTVIGDQKDHPLQQLYSALAQDLMKNSSREPSYFIQAFCQSKQDDPTQAAACKCVRPIFAMAAQNALSQEKLLAHMQQLMH
jgi:hypothetical protein